MKTKQRKPAAASRSISPILGVGALAMLDHRVDGTGSWLTMESTGRYRPRLPPAAVDRIQRTIEQSSPSRFAAVCSSPSPGDLVFVDLDL
jgi:hypothetical protein